MNYKLCLSFGFVLLCAAALNQSLLSANAASQGPNISLGGNPIANFTAACGSWSTLYTNTTTQNFVVTDVVHSYPSSNVTLQINTQTIYASREPTRFVSGLIVAAGETVTCAHSGYEVTISGYYAH